MLVEKVFIDAVLFESFLDANWFFNNDNDDVELSFSVQKLRLTES
jgi:hypothetical protein